MKLSIPQTVKVSPRSADGSNSAPVALNGWYLNPESSFNIFCASVSQSDVLIGRKGETRTIF